MQVLSPLNPSLQANVLEAIKQELSDVGIALADLQ
jgi:hypothetical protein